MSIINPSSKRVTVVVEQQTQFPIGAVRSVALALALAGAAGIGMAQPLAAQTTLDKDSDSKSSLRIVATSVETFGNTITLHRLTNGQVLVNDTRAKRIVLLDSSLNVIRTLTDSAQASAITYGRRPGMMVPYRGDSTVFVDGSTLSMLILDENGHSVGTMALRQTRDASFISDARFGKLSFDRAGNMIYKAGPAFFSPPKEEFPGMSGVMLPKDSAPLVRVRGGLRTIDTVTFIHVPVPRMVAGVDSSGAPFFITKLNPLDTFDDWAVLGDGTVGVFRGRDFTLELFDATSQRRTSTKVAFNWRRLSDFEKSALLDSAKVRRGIPIGAASMGQRIQFIDPSELADYFPAFGPNSVFVDNNDNFWVKILPTTQTTKFTYQVIDRTGKMIRQVLVDKSSEILSIERDGSILLLTRIDSPDVQPTTSPVPLTQFKLQRAKIH